MVTNGQPFFCWCCHTIKKLKYSTYANQFWSGVIPKNGDGRIYLTLTAVSPNLTLHLTHSWYPFSPNQHSCSLSSTPSLVVLTSSSTSLQTPTLFSKRAYHPSSTYASTISLHLPLPSEPMFPLIPTSPLGPLFSFSPSVLHHTLLSPLLSRSFSKMLSHFPLNKVHNYA